MLSDKLLVTGIHKSPLSFILNRWQRLFDHVLLLYRRVMTWALRNRVVTLLMALALLALTVLIVLPRLDTELLPATNEGEFRVEWTQQEGTRLEVTDAMAKEMEAAVMRMPQVAQVYTTIGRTAGIGEPKANLAVLSVKLKSKDSGQIISVMEQIRSQWQGHPGAKLVVKQITATEGMQREPVNVRIIGNDLATLEALGRQVYPQVAAIPGVVNLSSSVQENVSEFGIKVDRLKAADLGLNSSLVARTVRDAVLGASVTKLSVDGKEYDITVKMDERRVRSVNDLLDLPLTTSKGRIVPLRAVAEINLERSPSEIKRFDQQRVVEIKADVAGRPQREVTAEVKKNMAQISLPNDYAFGFGGQSKSIAESFRSLLFALVIAIFLVYVVMGAQFNSFLHPFTIAFTIPLALIGVLLGLWVFGAALSMNALLGMILLVGVVVNNGILLIDYIQQLRARGESRDEAIINGGSTRLRPILITSLTTIFGMLPLALGLGEGGEALAPLGAVVLGGLTTSTFLTLIVIPCVYSLFESLKSKLRRRSV
jgi:HAE1 family hydrophobic/amphiphilic exporter-1